MILYYVGVTAHHIRFNDVSKNLQEYEKLLEHVLLPLIKQSLAVHPHQEIIWLYQSPTNYYLSRVLETANKMEEVSSNTMIPHYNRSIRRIFK